MDLSLDFNSTYNSRNQLILTPKYLTKLKSCKRILTPLLIKQRSKVTLNEDCKWKNVVINLEDSIAMESNISLEFNSTYNSRSQLILNPKYQSTKKSFKRILKPLLTKQRSKVTLNKDCNWKDVVYNIEDSSHVRAIQYKDVHIDSNKAEIVVTCTEKQGITIDGNNNNTSQTTSKRIKVTSSESPLQVTKPLRYLPPNVVFVIALNT